MFYEHWYHNVGYIGGGRLLDSAAVKRLVSALRDAARLTVCGVQRAAFGSQRRGAALFPRARLAGLHNMSLSFN